MNSVNKSRKSFKRQICILKSISEFSQYKVIITDLEYSLKLPAYFKIRLMSLLHR